MGFNLGGHLAHFLSIFGERIFIGFLEWILGESAVPGSIDPGLGWGGGFLAGDPFTGFYWQVRLIRLAAGFQPGAADPLASGLPATVPDRLWTSPWTCLGHPQGSLGPPLEAPGASLGTPGARLDAPWTPKGRSWDPLAPPLGPPGCPLGCPLDPQRRPRG